MQDEFARLSVSGESSDRESFDRWLTRVRGDIPHVPACVAENWLYQHGVHTPYAWLPLSRLRFDLQTWDLARVLKIDEGVDPLWCLSWSEGLGTESLRRESRLGQYMLSHGTWPVPIIVLDNAGGIQSPHGAPIARWHLVEGHMRSAYMDHLAKSGQAQAQHQVWVATVVDGPDDGDGDYSEGRDRQHIREAVRSLATGQSDLRARLLHVCRYNLRNLQEGDIPRHRGARSRFAEIRRRLYKLRDQPSNDFDLDEAESTALMLVEVLDIIEELSHDSEINRLRKERDSLRAEVAQLKSRS